MNEDIHNGDENFKKAYRNMEEAPSPEVWGKISARLDNTDAVYYRNRLVMWKRIACILLLLIGSACAYEMFFNKKDNSVAKAVIENNVQKPGSETTMTEELSKDSSLVSQPPESRPSNKINSFSDAKNNLHNSLDHSRHLYRQNWNVHERESVDAAQNMNLTNRKATLQNSNNSLKDQPYIDQPVFTTREQSKPGDTAAKNSIHDMNATPEALNEPHPGNKDTINSFSASENIADKQHHSKPTTKAAQSISLKQFSRYWTITP